MGCMHGFVWGDLSRLWVRRLAPFACNAVAIAGRNRMWRKMSIEAIKADPLWNAGNYTEQPTSGLRTARSLSNHRRGQRPGFARTVPDPRTGRGSAGQGLQRTQPIRNDANDTIYWYDSSRNYDPSKDLEKITVPVLWINSADDFINPPEFGLPEKMVSRMPRAQFILIPFSPETKGHGTHTWAKFWKDDLAKLMAMQ